MNTDVFNDCDIVGNTAQKAIDDQLGSLRAAATTSTWRSGDTTRFGRTDQTSAERSQRVFADFQSGEPMQSTSVTAVRNPTVLISYSHDSESHEDSVLALANRLRADGLDCELDQYVPGGAPPEGWPRWMQARIEQSDFTIMICNQTYARRVLRREKPGVGRGVIWEATLLYNLLYYDEGFKSRAVPVLIGEGTVDDIPLPFRDNFCDLRSDDGYQLLLQRLYGTARAEKPTIGAAPKRTSKRPETAEVPGARVTPPATAAIDPADLDRITRQLAVYIGPIARLLVRRAAAGARSPAALIDALAAEIESECDRTVFRTALRLGRKSA